MIGWPCEKTWAAPRQAAKPPSVTTKAGTFNLAIANPWINPAPAPTAMAASAAIENRRSRLGRDC